MSRPIPPPLANFDLTMRSTSRRRDRSGSIVKVEQVGDRSAEEFLDRSAYVNINANWVNVKGYLYSSLTSICLLTISYRCMAHPRSPHPVREDYHRHNTRDDCSIQLDFGQLELSRGTPLAPFSSCEQPVNSAPF